MSYEAPNELCEAVKRMLAQHGEAVEKSLQELEHIQFARFTSTTPKQGDERENVYFSVLGAREFHDFLHLLAAQAKSNTQQPETV